MTEPYTQEVLMELLTRIHDGQSDIAGEDLPIFERLLWWRFVFHDGATADGYKGACTTREGDIQLLTWADMNGLDKGSTNDR